MHIKRYEAATMAEAIAQIREELGSDALILQTRQVRREGVFGVLAKPIVEVTAALDRNPEPEAPPPLDAETHEQGDSAEDRNWRGIQMARVLMQPIEDEVRSLRKTVDILTVGGSEPLTIAHELAELRALVGDMRQRDLTSTRPHAAALIAAGLEPRHAFSIAEEAVSQDMDPRHACQATLARRIEERLAPPRGDEPPITFMVGPTGSGKTTSLAKVAGRERSARPDLALMTTDSHRYGAEMLLRRLSRDLEVPFDVAVSPESLAERVKRFGPRPLFVDTAGRSPKDKEGISDLRALREVLGGRAHVQLVLSATTKQKDLQAQIARFRPLAPDGLIVTRTDESEDMLSVVNLLLDEKSPPLRWLGDGQRVPEDLQIPDPFELAERVVGAVA